MDLRLTAKTARVTGGSEGIGKGIAITFAKEGADVEINGGQDKPLMDRFRDKPRG